MNFHIINLDRRQDRWQKILSQISNSSSTFNYNRISAIDGKQIIMNREYTHLLRNYKYPKNRGAIAYAMTTIKLWQQLLISDDEYMIIMDDDVTFCDNFEQRINELIKILDKFDVCMFGYIISSNDDKYNMNSESMITIDNMNRHPYYSGSFGYLITRQGANKLLKLIKDDGLLVPIDTMFLYCMRSYIKGITILCTIPRLVYTEVATENNQVDSDIQRDQIILT
jgi:GR25 family glycosyltransferase involved in LPS biosynthesis